MGNVKAIEATIVFDDGEKARVSLGPDNDQAWGNSREVLGRTVAVREAITRAMHEDELYVREEGS